MSEHKASRAVKERVLSQSNQFRQYAEEALLSASQSKNETEIKALAELAQVWALAAFQSERAEACKTVR